MRAIHRTLLDVLFFLLLVNICAFSADLKMGQWMKEWTVCGPIQLQVGNQSDLTQEHIPGFETDYLVSIGGESNPNIVNGQNISVNGNTLTFKDIAATDSVVSLDDFISKKDIVCAYMYREINSPKEQICFLSLGCNDGGRVWLNGTQIWDRPEPRGVIADDILLPVLLKKGKNTLLFKVEERANVWAFCARFLPIESKIRPVSYFEMINRDSQAILRYKFEEGGLSSLFHDTNIVVSLMRSPDTIVWQGPLQAVKEMTLPINSELYERYNMTFTARFPDGQSWKESYNFSVGDRQLFELFSDLKTSYVIVVDKNASDSEQWAAKELQSWSEQISGAYFPIVNDFDVSRPSVVVGYHPDVNKAFPTLVNKPDKMDESFIYRNVGQHIIILGGSQRGTMYGIFSFLENEFGVRWYTPAVTIVPEKAKYTFDYLYHQEAPGICVRNDFYYEAFNPIWAARNRVNGAMDSRKQPGGVEGYWAVHTFYRFMPPTEFYDEHPEYYSLIDGKRIHERAQLCLTNPDVFKIITKRLKQAMRENPDCLIFSVSQNDYHNPCQCEHCQKIAKEEETEAGPLIWFVNKVAKEVEKEFPDKYVGTLAYQYTRKPCKNIKPRENVVIRLCSIECCFAHDFKSCPENQSFMDDLQAWSAIAPHMYIWDYVVNFSHYTLPYPNFGVLQENIKTFRENNSIGIMEQAAYQSRGGEFAELRAYVISKLLWNPDCDVDAVIDDFMYGYYGRSGQYVKEYFDLLHGLVTPLTHIHLGLKPDDKIFPDSFIANADKIFDKAEAVADNLELLQRVEMARLPLMYLKCLRYPLQSKQDGTYSRFCEISDREGITHYAEHGLEHKNAFHQLMEYAK